MATHKEIKKKYMETWIPKGVYALRNMVNGKVFVGTSMNLPGARNGTLFQLNMGSHINKELQKEWKEFGPERFTFEVLQELEEHHDPSRDDRADLAVLEELVLAELQPYGEKGYNKPPKDES